MTSSEFLRFATVLSRFERSCQKVGLNPAVAVDTLLEQAANKIGLHKPKKEESLNYDERYYASNGRKIDAVKSYRNRCNVNLLEAKNAVEDWMKANGNM